jgi:hypothetical protein
MAAQTLAAARHRIAVYFAKYRERPKSVPGPKPVPGPVPAPPGDDVLRMRSGQVELIMSHAGMSGRNFRRQTAGAIVPSFFGLFLAAPVLFTIAALADPTSRAMSPASVLAASSATLLCFVVLVILRLPRALRISFTPADGPAHVRIVRWWRVRRIPLSALSGITVIEYRYRRSGETAAGDAQRETISRLPYRIDAVLHRVVGGSWTVRGQDGQQWDHYTRKMHDTLASAGLAKGDQEWWRPDTRNMYGPLAELLAPAGLTIDRQPIWTQRPVRHDRWFSPGSGGANALGGVLPRACQRCPEHVEDYPRMIDSVEVIQITANGSPPR